MISVHFKANHAISLQAYAPTSNAEEAELEDEVEQFYEDYKTF